MPLFVGKNILESLSAYFQVFSNRRAVFECLYSFRRFYRAEPVTLLSDAGDDFSDMADWFGCEYVRGGENILPGGRMAGLPGVAEYLRRIYEHCLSVDTDWVLLLEEDVVTLRRVREFPSVECAGPRMNAYSPALTEFLTAQFGARRFGYGMCGGSVFRRDAFISAYESQPDWRMVAGLDERVAGWGDIPLTLVFHLAGFDYGVWGEVSERTHPVAPIVRDAAFDHAFKFWYGVPFGGVDFSHLGI